MLFLLSISSANAFQLKKRPTITSSSYLPEVRDHYGIIINPKGVQISHSPGVPGRYEPYLDCGTNVTIYSIDSSKTYYQIEYKFDKRWVSVKDVQYYSGVRSVKAKYPTTMVAINNRKLNSNIRRWGAEFLCICYIAGIQTVEDINTLYSKAVANDWMRSDCLEIDYGAFCEVIKAKYVRHADSRYKLAANERQVVDVNLRKGGSNHVVADAAGKILYDPAGNSDIYSAPFKVVFGY